jgi:hypothetical protein
MHIIDSATALKPDWMTREQFKAATAIYNRNPEAYTSFKQFPVHCFELRRLCRVIVGGNVPWHRKGRLHSQLTPVAPPPAPRLLNRGVLLFVLFPALNTSA